ncbi:receptor-type tyrosine-protein phosphatase eta [Ctenodactylus gundi]
MGVAQVVLSWLGDPGTVSFRMLLESLGSQEGLAPDVVANISGLKPGFQKVTLSLLESNETLEPERGWDGGVTETRSPASAADTGQPRLDPASDQEPELTEVLVAGLKPGVQYNATVYSQAADGTEGQPRDAVQQAQGRAGGSAQAGGVEGGGPVGEEMQCGAVLASGEGCYPTAWISTLNPDSSQVCDLRAVNVSASGFTLTWNVTHRGSPATSTYNISVAGPSASFALSTVEAHADVRGLRPGSLYHVTVRPALREAEGTLAFLRVYTAPSPVSDFRVTSIGIRDIGLAWSSNDSESFTILTTQDGAGSVRNDTTTNQNITIGGLKPRTLYHFEIFSQGPNGTEGASQAASVMTARSALNFSVDETTMDPCPAVIQSSSQSPSAVFSISVVNVTSTGLELEWQNTDTASGYIYHVAVQSASGPSVVNSTWEGVSLQGLLPGTLYNVTVTPEWEQILGDSGSIVQYTRPSRVLDVQVDPTATMVNVTWRSPDVASGAYSYRLLVEKTGEAGNATELVTVVGATSTVVTALTPGSSCAVTVFAQVGGATESLASEQKTFCTDAAPVGSVLCDAVPREPSLVLRWARPPGANVGFSLRVSSSAWDSVRVLDSCPPDNDTECAAEVACLNFSTSYNVSLATLSCGAPAPPALSACLTGITDPPSPDGSPNITSVSHNSVKVKFSGFEASHGPIKAYAVVLTTGEAGHPSADMLRYTYEDYRKGASDTYVTYLLSVQDPGPARGLPGTLKYEVNVGNESTTQGYYNGKLEPLGSYRACVAGFTNITFNPKDAGLISGAESYVSFSPCSDAVFLPQDPGVICGAVFGCIFGALVIVAVGGFIFWRKKRKDAKNNDVSFSQINPRSALTGCSDRRSKLVRVENFEAYFKKQQADSNCGFAEEYEDLKLVGLGLSKSAAELAQNRGKNRYNNVLPYDMSRVQLSIQAHSTDDYVNANYMPGYHSKRDFIATQGPLPNTLKDFWRMVWEKNVYAIVMLTKCVEQGRTKCEEYWPSKQAQDYGHITVALTSEVVLPEWTVRDFTVKNAQTSESHPLKQFHFTSWPDHGVPDTTDLLINFRYLVRDYMKQVPPESPILVHCSAGVGRTGTFIAIDRLIYQIENENMVDVYGIVYDLRMHRPLMVQTEDQYVFLNQCVLDIVRSQRDSKVDLIYQNTTALTIYENLEPMSMFGKTNGYLS